MTPWLREIQVQNSYCNDIQCGSFSMYQRDSVYDTAGMAIFTLEVAVMVDVFGIRHSQAVFKMEWLVKFSALIIGIRCYLVNFKLCNFKNKLPVSVCFVDNILFAWVFTQISEYPQGFVPACSRIMVNSRNGSLVKGS